MAYETIEEILAVLERHSGKYPREAIDAAIARREEIVPHLIRILEEVKADPAKYLADVEYTGYVFAVILLGYFKEEGAHQLIVDVFSLPEASPLFDDMITEDLPLVLYRTCGGSVESIKALALNSQVDEFCRSSALRAVNFAVLEKVVSRDEALELYRTLLNDPEVRRSLFVSLVVSEAAGLCPVELRDIIYQIFDEDLVDPFIIDREYFDKLLAEGEEAGMQRIRQDMERHSMDDIHGYMSWWAMFEDSSIHHPVSPMLKQKVKTAKKPKIMLDKPKTKSSAKKKAKRKMVQASKKQQRKKKRRR